MYILNKLKRFLPIVFALLSFAVFASPGQITSIRTAHNTTYRIIFDLSNATPYHYFQLKNPARLVIDIKNINKAASVSMKQIKGFPIKDIRKATKSNHTVRYVFELTKLINIKAFTLSPSHGRGHRIVFDLTTKHVQATTQTFVKAQPKKSSAKPMRHIVVVLDPGHGGRDPGATGPAGTHEKNITLAIGLKLRLDLQKVPGIKVYMTRTKDVYPTLGQRLALARRVKADMYISIHADAFRRRSAHGATVFALSRGRATSEAAQWLADRENKSELLGGVDLADKGYTLRSVLVDLSQTATISSSLKFGGYVAHYLSKVTAMHSRRVQQASLYVLTSPDIPAILVETGFISNPKEEKELNNSAHQSKIARAIKQGIVRYLLTNPIQNTIFTARMFGGKYIVKSGDRLSTIAAKFGVSQTKLKQVNALTKSTVFVGQVIRIPSK